MKRMLLFAMGLLMGASAMNAQVYIETDLTSQFNSLTQKANWRNRDGNTCDYVGWAAPSVTTNSGVTTACVEYYQGTCANTGTMMYATVTGLAAGTYKIELYGGSAYTFGRGFDSDLFSSTINPETGTAWAANQAYTVAMAENADGVTYPTETGAVLYANSEGVEYDEMIPVWYATDFNTAGVADMALSGIEVGSSGSIEIGIKKTAANTNWSLVMIKGVTAQVDAAALLASVVEKAEAVDPSTVPATLYAELTQAVEDNNGEYETGQEYLDAINAIQAVLDKVDVIVTATPILEAMKALVDATNVYTEEAYEEYYGQWQAKYEAGTLTAAEVAGLQNPKVITGWHDAITVDNFLLSAWDTNPDFDNAPYYINTWSVEGESDGSGFTVPFFEYWTGDDGLLEEKVLTATMNDVDPGYYVVKAWVRVRRSNSSSDPTYGITFQGLDGEIADVCDGDQIGDSPLFIKEVESVCEVGEDGVLQIHFIVDSETNVNWLSFKNVTFEPYALAPESVEFDDPELVVAKGGEATITYTVVPDGAATDVTFESYDESIATVDENGVVTGVAVGTTTIKVATVADPSVYGELDVTVTLPNITEAANLDFSEGPVVTDGITIRTYAKDKTGDDVSGMQDVAGWTMGVENGDARAAGVVTYGSSIGLGSPDSFTAPAAGPDANANEYVLGMVGVWTGSVQYLQEVAIPAGYYTVKVPVYKVGGNNALAKNLIGVVVDGVEHFATTKTYTADQWTVETIKFSVEYDTQGQISLGLEAPNTGSLNSQRLYIDRVDVEYEPFATPEQMQDLQDAIDQYADNMSQLGFSASSYAPYNNVENIQAIAAAQELIDNAPAGETSVLEATANLENLQWNENMEDLNAVYNGDFALSTPNQTTGVDVDVPGWTPANGFRKVIEDGVNGVFPGLAETESGKAVFVWGSADYKYGETLGYTMPLDWGMTYQLSFKYTGWEGGNQNFRVSLLNSEGVGIPTTVCGVADVGPQGEDCWKTYRMWFQTLYESDNNFVLTMSPGGNATFTDVEIMPVNYFSISENDDYDCTQEGYVWAGLDRTFKTGLNTLVLPYDVTDEYGALTDAYFGEGYKIYELSGLKNGNSLILTQVDRITANKPCLVKIEDEDYAGERSIWVDGDPELLVAAEPVAVGDDDTQTAVADFFEGVAFVGAYTTEFEIPASTEDELFYVISNNKLFNVTTPVTTKSTRAFFYLSENGGAVKDLNLVLVDNDGTTTSITSLDGGETFVNADGIYDISGRAVKTPAKGLYIVDGKKVLVK